MINYYADRTRKLMANAGCTIQVIKETYEHFDNHGHRVFQQPNIRQLRHHEGEPDQRGDEQEEDEINDY
eukprot:3955616-Amphidinium_carterae.1